MKVNGNWVYVHRTPDGMCYAGRSERSDTEERWKKQNYKKTSLGQEIEVWGWENIEHILIADGLTVEESYKMEQELILFFEANGVCINKRKSGLLWKEDYDGMMKEYQRKYQRKYYIEHRENLCKQSKEYRKEYYIKHRKSILDNKKEYYNEHRKSIIDNKKEYYNEHRKSIIEKRKEYYIKHRESIREKRKRNYQRKKENKQLKDFGYIPLW